MKSSTFQKAFKELKRFGLLLLSDARLPSITTLVAGEPIRGSWWGHSKGGEIFRVASLIDDHPDVAVTKLISGKVTFVHRKLWPALLAVATAREPWQMKGLSRKGRDLLQRVDQVGEVEMDRLLASSKTSRSAWNQAARELEERLLIHAEQYHSETGAHVKRLETWTRWAKRVGLVPGRMKSEEGKQMLAEQAQKLGRNSMSMAKLAWLKK